ncbi:MAG: PfkB family carbohydrate kinase [Planctomycetota bacterium]|nr:PfkB family carbohydrate kinase [Planctomycetota bacterium]
MTHASRHENDNAPGQGKRTRSEIARTLAEALAAPRPQATALVGFDGFIDAIIHVVDQRHAMDGAGYSRLETIEQFAVRCAGAAGKSTNMELIVKEQRFGGNGPLLAGALARLGVKTSYVGAVGEHAAKPERGGAALHPLFAELGTRCEASGGRVVPLGPPAETDALEFTDGKLMLGKTGNLQAMTWEFITRVVGLEPLRRMVGESALLGIVNWTMMGSVPEIWRGLIRDVFENEAKPATRGLIFIDLCDPAKRTDSDVLEAIQLLGRLNQHRSVTLGLNEAEAERVAKVLGLESIRRAANAPLGRVVQDAARAIRTHAGVDCVVIHPRFGAGAATAHDAAWFDGPFTREPRLSTGAGDHFNAGFAAAQVFGLDLEQCLALGCATSGAYVRDAESPTLDRLRAFLTDLPLPQA